MTPKPRNPQALRFTPESIRGLLNVRVGTWPPEPIDPAKPCKWQTRRLITQAHAGRYAVIDPSHRDATIEDFCYVYEDLACAPDCELDAMAQVLAAKLRSILRIRAGDVVYINEPVAFCYWWDIYVVGSEADGGVHNTEPCPIEWARPARFEVMDVRPERLQDISHDDVTAEGIAPAPPPPVYVTVNEVERSCGDVAERVTDHVMDWVAAARDRKERFIKHWDAINRKRGTRWADNPWVAAYKLKRIA